MGKLEIRGRIETNKNNAFLKSARHEWIGKLIHWELRKKFKFDQMVKAQPQIRPTKWGAQTSLGFWNTNGLSHLGHTTRPSDCQQKKKKKRRKRTCWIEGFAVPADYSVKTERKCKES